MKVKQIILAMLTSMFLLVSCANNTQEINSSYKSVTTQEAITIMNQESNYIILDVRTKEEYQEKHIKGAINVPNETISSTQPKELPDKSQLILVYCRSGNRSKQAAKKLVAMGYTNIIEFGGINSWTGQTTTGSNP